jgi:hypothetical protein
MQKDQNKYAEFSKHSKKIFRFQSEQHMFTAHGKANLAVCIQEGLESSDSFVRAAFIDLSNNFITNAFEILANDEDLVKHFKAFIKAYTTQLGKVQIKDAENKTKGQTKKA